MRTDPNGLAFIQNDDLIGVADRTDSLGNDHAGNVPKLFWERSRKIWCRCFGNPLNGVYDDSRRAAATMAVAPEHSTFA